MLKLIASKKLILASGSPRRREMLSTYGFTFEAITPQCDESVQLGESPENLVKRLSELKAATVADLHPEAWVIGADTVVYIDGEILGKPIDKNEAAIMLSKIAGRRHVVWGGFSIINRSSSFVYTEAHASEVTIVPMDEAMIESYILSGEPMDKAGSYAIQGIGAGLVSSVSGSYTNVVGLNLSAVLTALIKNQVMSAE